MSFCLESKMYLPGLEVSNLIFLIIHEVRKQDGFGGTTLIGRMYEVKADYYARHPEYKWNGKKG